jgi:sulfhydrogenase subunit delta
MKTPRKPKLAVWKFASCDGCQLSLLDCEDELLAVAGEMEISNFVEASRAVVKGPYDLSLVEGSITTPHDIERIHQVRHASKRLVTIGACATAGGIQALRNFKDVNEFMQIVYATPAYVETLSKSTPIADHVLTSISSCAAARSTSISSSKSSARSCATASRTRRLTACASSASCAGPFA